MKKITFLFTLLIVFHFAGNAQWVQLNSGTTKCLKSVRFTSPNIGYAVGDTGTIVKTKNGGANWIAQNSGVKTNLN